MTLRNLPDCILAALYRRNAIRVGWGRPPYSRETLIRRGRWLARLDAIKREIERRQ